MVFLVKVLHGLNLAGKLMTEGPAEGSPPPVVPAAVGGGMWEKGGETQALEGRKPEQVSMRDVKWLINRLSRLAKYEAGHHPKEALKRTCVLQWTAAVSLELGAEHLPLYLPVLLRPVHRELVDSNMAAGEALHGLAQEVAELMKGVCGREDFSKAYSQVHQSVVAVRERRRKQAALEVVRTLWPVCVCVCVCVTATSCTKCDEAVTN